MALLLLKLTLVQPDLSFNKTSVEDTDAEATRLDDALAKSTEELQAIRDKALKALVKQKRKFSMLI